MFKKENREESTRQTVQGNWKCGGCGTEITELPFEPSPDRPIYCRDCWANKRDQSKQGGGFNREPAKGNWKCSDCGTGITEMPFEPSPGRPIYCRDCWRKRKDR